MPGTADQQGCFSRAEFDLACTSDVQLSLISESSTFPIDSLGSCILSLCSLLLKFDIVFFCCLLPRPCVTEHVTHVPSSFLRVSQIVLS